MSEIIWDNEQPPIPNINSVITPFVQNPAARQGDFSIGEMQHMSNPVVSQPQPDATIESIRPQLQYQQATPSELTTQAALETAKNMLAGAPTAAAELAEGAGSFGLNVGQNLGKMVGGPNVTPMSNVAEIAKNTLANITENTRQYYTGERNERPIGAEADAENLPESRLTMNQVEDYISKRLQLSENAKQVLRAKAEPETAVQSLEKTVANTPGAQGIVTDAKGLAQFITTAPVEGFKAVRIALADSGLIDAHTSDEELKQEILKNPMGVFGRIAASAAMGYGAVKGLNKARVNEMPQTELESAESKIMSDQNLQDTVRKSADYQQLVNDRNPEYEQAQTAGIKYDNQAITRDLQNQAKERKASVIPVDTANYYPEIKENNLTTKNQIVDFYKNAGEDINREEAARRLRIAWPDESELETVKSSSPMTERILDNQQITTDYLTGKSDQKPVVTISSTSERPSAVEAPLKEPWQMSKIEYGLNEAQRLKYAGKYQRYRPDLLNSMHRTIVEKALAEGQNVPPEVLAEYPELQTNKTGVRLGLFNLQDAYDYITGTNSRQRKTGGILDGDPYYEERRVEVDETNKIAKDLQQASEARKPGIGVVLKSIFQDKYSLPQKVLGAAKDRTAAQKAATAITDLHYKRTLLDSLVNDVAEDVFQPLDESGISANEFEAFLDANRYVNEIQKKEAAKNIDPKKFQEASVMLKTLEQNNPEAFQKMVEAKEKWQDNLKFHGIDYLLESGVISKARYDGLVKNRDYVTFVTSEPFFKSIEAGAAGSEASAKIHELKGTNKGHMDTIWATMQKMAALKSLAIENNARRQFVNIFKTMSPDEIEEGTALKHNYKYFEDGEAKYLNFKNADLAKILNEPHSGITRVPLVPAALSLFSAAQKLGTMVFTKLNPAWFVANLGLDAGDVAAAPYSFKDKAKIFANYPKVLAKETAASFTSNRRTPEVRELERIGVGMPQNDTFTTNVYKTPLEQTLGTAGDGLKHWLNPNEYSLADKIKAVGNYIMGLPDKIVKPTENMPKAAALNVMKGKVPTEKLIELLRETGSPEFSKKGLVTPAFTIGALFVNPNIQGTARLLKHVRQNPLGAAVAMSPFALWGLARLSNYYSDDPKTRDDARRRPMRDYVNYTIIPVGDKEVRIPNPRPVRFFLNAIAGLSEGDFMGFMQRANDIYSDIAPSAAPWVRNAMTVGSALNGKIPEDFTGKPIVSKQVLDARDKRLVTAVGKQIYNEWFGGLFGYAEPDPIKAQEREAFPEENDTMVYKGPGGQSLHRFVRKQPTEQAWDSLRSEKAKYQDAPKASAELFGQEIGIKMKADRAKFGKPSAETTEQWRTGLKDVPPEYRRKAQEALKREMVKLNTVGLSNEARQYMLMSKADKIAFAKRVGGARLKEITDEIRNFNKK